MRLVAPLFAVALVVGVGAFVYCCGPKAKPPIAGCIETCKHDSVGDYDCTCEE